MKAMEQLDFNNNAKRMWCLQQAFRKSVGESLPVMVSIGSYASIAKIMSQFQMTQIIALLCIFYLFLQCSLCVRRAK